MLDAAIAFMVRTTDWRSAAPSILQRRLAADSLMAEPPPVWTHPLPRPWIQASHEKPPARRGRSGLSLLDLHRPSWPPYRIARVPPVRSRWRHCARLARPRPSVPTVAHQKASPSKQATP